MKFLLAAINAKYIHSNPGVYSLRAFARTKIPGADIEIGEYTINHQMDLILQDIYRRKPDFIGFSCYIWNISYIMEIVRDVKKVLPEVEIWLGGPEVSYDAKKVLTREPDVCGVMRGEGELTFTELVRAYLKREELCAASLDLDHIPGITYRAESGEVVERGPQRLLSLDEIGRGTSTFDGLSIAWAVVEHIANTRLLGAKTLFATHYHELTELQGKLSGVNNYCIAVKEKGDDIVFLRKIVKGGADKSYGIQVAKLAGVPDSVIERAKELVEELSDADITERAKEIEAAGSAPQAKTVTKVRNRPKTYDQVDMGQMALFDTAKDEDILKELSEMEIASMTPLEALNTLNRLQSKLKNRWSVTGVQG